MTMAEDRHVDFGTFLRQAREQRGVTLQQMAVTTKISARVLDALERNDPSKLPGGLFSRAFVRAYAREVGVDPEAAVARFVSAFPDDSGADEMPSATSAVEAETFEQGRHVVRLAARVLGVVALAAILVFMLYLQFRPGTPPAESASVQLPASEPVSQAPASPPSQLPAPASSEPSLANGAQDLAAPPPEQPEAALPAAAAADPATTPGTDSGTTAPPRVPLAIILTANEACWLSISVDGTRVPSRTLNAGERVEFTVLRSITLTAGNAGALAITLNGRPARPIGAAGEVVTRTISASGYETFLR
jgi:cytoskeletal protein RodZ